MREEPELLEQNIIDCLKISYGIDVTELVFLPLGADMQASVYKAQTHHQLSYFVKIKHGHCHDISTIVTSFLLDAGIQQIIPIIKTIHGQLTAVVHDFTITVCPFIDGWDGFNRSLSETQWCTLGKVMRQVHNINIPLSVEVQLQRESFSAKGIKALRCLYPLIDAAPRGDKAAVNLLTFMKKHKDIIQKLVDRTEQLAREVQDCPAQFVLCHSDLHAGNVLMSESGSIYIVDWDSPIMAPKERDLMFIGAGVGNVWNKPHEHELFYKGYGRDDVNQKLLTYYRYERIILDIAEYGEHLLLSSTGGQDRIKWYEEFTAQFAPNGVVEIALKTDDDPIQ